MTNTLTFGDTDLAVIDRDGERWLTARDVGAALGFSDQRKVLNLYNRNADEFTDGMSGILKLRTPSGSDGRGGGLQDTRIFSLRGAHLVAMLAKTERAKEFRRWLLDLIEVEQARGSAERDRLRIAASEDAGGGRLTDPRAMPWLDSPAWWAQTAGARARWRDRLYLARRRLWDLGDFENGLPPGGEL